MTAEEMKFHLERLSLKPTGSHVPLERLRNHLEEEIQYNKIIGNKYLVCPWAQWENTEECISLGRELNEIGKKLQKAEMQLLYHNHAHEFEMVEDQYGLDVLFEEMDSNSVMAEIDTFWVFRAEVDPVRYIKSYKGRCPLIHIKDMKDDVSKEFAAVGEGIIDIQEIADAAKENGAQCLIVENDQPKPSGIENITTSMKNLRKMGLI